jgi:predicted AAA+ superfamily ATPase
MKRIYESILIEHLEENRQMAFLAGPRQVGKTTSSRSGAGDHKYMNWDNQTDRRIITKGPDSVAKHLKLEEKKELFPRIVFDEIHKYGKWKSFLKGFFDIYGSICRSIVTGSARLNVFKHGGDSLMGRYFLYRMHPLSIGELLDGEFGGREIRIPGEIDKGSLDQLIEYGGFPEPFLKNDPRFYNRWSRLRDEQFFYEDIRDFSRVTETAQLRVLSELLRSCVGMTLNYSWLSGNVNVSVDTIRRWIGVLESLYYCFIVRPWFSNVPKSLRKQPKLYLWDWSLVNDRGARVENFVASHLLKAVHFWTDIGLGDYGLYFLRDKYKKEVDFLVVKDNFPWFLVEVKSSSKAQLNPNLRYFQDLLNAPHAFQVCMDMDYKDFNCFNEKNPVRVPVMSLLSQLV